MSKKTTKTPPPAEVDEHTGQGGSYVINPDGTRELVARTKPTEQSQDKEPKHAQA